MDHMAKILHYGISNLKKNVNIKMEMMVYFVFHKANFFKLSNIIRFVWKKLNQYTHILRFNQLKMKIYIINFN